MRSARRFVGRRGVVELGSVRRREGRRAEWTWPFREGERGL